MYRYIDICMYIKGKYSKPFCFNFDYHGFFSYSKIYRDIFIFWVGAHKYQTLIVKCLKNCSCLEQSED